MRGHLTTQRNYISWPLTLAGPWPNGGGLERYRLSRHRLLVFLLYDQKNEILLLGRKCLLDSKQ